MRPVIRSVQAEEDLLEIWDYVADDDPDAADALLRKIAAAMQMIAENPEAGRLRLELAPDIRSFGVGKYLIFYRSTEGGILVVRILHGARDLPDLL
jgi:toxin ParE1/3/4